MKVYNVIGVMSGTSLDGLDIAHCMFTLNKNQQWEFKIISFITVDFDIYLKKKLTQATEICGLELMKLHNEFGNFIGHSIEAFIKKNQIKKEIIDCISSHGHTIFHQPNIHLTTQIGNGANISAITKLPVICDFRTIDVALTGQGAPLVPIGDRLLFHKYDYCINLGGIANISYEENNERIAFDVCPVNIVLNKLSQELGKSFDKNGKLSESGNLNLDLLNKLNGLSYYNELHPKSLGIEWILQYVFPLLNSYNINVEDKLRTFVEHIAIQIGKTIISDNKKILITGGGAFNSFLVQQIKSQTDIDVIIPEPNLINFKEALIFAFLGILRLKNEPNCLQSVTGATENSIGGCIYQAF